MSDYLQDSLRTQDGTIQIDEEKSRQQLASFCFKNLKTCDVAARNFVFHLAEAGERKILSKICVFTWLEIVLVEKVLNPRKFVVGCDEYFVCKQRSSFDAELVVRSLENGLNGLSMGPRQLGGQLHGHLVKNPNFRTLACKSSAAQDIGHSDYVFSLTFDDDVIVSGSSDATVKVWSSGDLLHTLEGHSLPANNVGVDGNVMASRHFSRTTIHWPIESRECLNSVNEILQEGGIPNIQRVHNFFQRRHWMRWFDTRWYSKSNCHGSVRNIFDSTAFNS